MLQKIKSIDDEYAVNPDPILYRERLRLQTDFDLLSDNKARLRLLKSRQRFFESGDKAGKLLAHQARAEATSRLIPAIRASSGELHTDPVTINKIFAEFYADLYTSGCPPIADETPNDMIFLQIDAESVNDLGALIATAEVQGAINSLQSGKSPGQDGFTVEYYKTFSASLAPVLKDMYNEAFHQRCLPDTLSKATISLIPKKGKDPLLCGSYRPISILNVDLKILAKVLALRLQRLMPSISSLDQTGFMPGRQTFHNTRQLLDIIHSSKNRIPEIVVSLDAEKAFDRVEWGYLYEAMDRFGLGGNFILWVRLLYSSPMASVQTNDVLSPPFSLRRGTRQGCPLSPLLFAIAIEPLAIWLRAEEGFKGITRFGVTHKVSLYADDLLLYISNPVTSHCMKSGIFDSYRRCRLSWKFSQVERPGSEMSTPDASAPLSKDLLTPTARSETVC
ncbi:hypothetical protein PO909_002470 [Leuciscus waleckii]